MIHRQGTAKKLPAAAAALLLAAALFTTGCQDEAPPQPAAPPPAPPPAPAKPPEEKSIRIRPPEPPPKPTIPRVVFSQEDLATCIVKVNDQMPEAELPDLDGKPQTLRSLWGKKLTVVFFWTAANPRSVDEARDMSDDVAAPFADKGVRVIGICRDATPDAAKGVIREGELKYPVLLDAKGDYFKRVAKDKPARVYVLDPDGKILWFDIEYSQSTHRQLLQTIEVALSKEV